MATNLKEFAQELKQQAPIEQVIADYVPSLNRRGRAIKGLCPFHEEKTPSFHVNPEFGFYYCFGCHAKGDAIRFVQEFEKVDFPMAVEIIARKFGIPVPEFKGQWKPGERDEAEKTRQTLLAICKIAEAFFIDQLWKPAGAAALNYLQKRGLSVEQIKTYRLGFAPDDYEAFLNEAKRRGYPPERAAEAGLAIQKDRGGFMDRFRNRVIFPITNPHGEVVAFGGRLMEGDGPKYLNSSDSPIFHKGKLLYGLSASREAIRAAGSVVLLEGYMDWIALHSNGIQNALAGLGTAFGEDQARFLRRITEEVILHYDGDEAGRKAAFRAAEFLLAQGLKTRVVELPEKDDPDSFIRANGVEAARAKLNAAQHAMEFFLQQAASAYPIYTPEGKLDAVEFLAPLLLAVKEPVLASSYAERVCSRIGIAFSSLNGSLARRRTGERRAEPAPAAENSLSPRDRLEYYLLSRLVKHVERWELFQRLQSEMFLNDSVRLLFARLQEKAIEIREGGEHWADPFEICRSDLEHRTMTHVLLIEERLAEGAFKSKSFSESFEMTLREIEELRLRLMRKHSVRARGEIRAKTAHGPLDDEHVINTSTIHAIGESVVRETELHFSRSVPAAQPEA
ncbi:DNA primase [Candidatus Sumerlaeota bacterium]|nr:DNA primase [Candidatus Sumerlaeota bacterium]